VPDARECRALPAQYQARAHAEGTAKRLANLLLSVSRNNASLAAQLDCLEQVEHEEAVRISLQKDTRRPSE